MLMSITVIKITVSTMVCIVYTVLLNKYWGKYGKSEINNLFRHHVFAFRVN